MGDLPALQRWIMERRRSLHLLYLPLIFTNIEEAASNRYLWTSAMLLLNSVSDDFQANILANVMTLSPAWAGPVSEKWTVTDGDPVGSIWDPLAGAYATSDGHVRIHTNFPQQVALSHFVNILSGSLTSDSLYLYFTSHRAGILTILGCKAESREAIAEALLSWRADEFETAAAEAGLCVSALRSFEQWDAHPQAKALADTNPVQINKVADGPPRSTSSRGENTAPAQPLEGIRVLDLTRIIAGPVCGRTLSGTCGGLVLRRPQVFDNTIYPSARG